MPKEAVSNLAAILLAANMVCWTASEKLGSPGPRTSH